jgi:hypothetical protein
MKVNARKGPGIELCEFSPTTIKTAFSGRTAFHQAARVRKKTAFFKMLPNCTSPVENLLETTTHYLLGKVARSFLQAIETEISKV